MSHTVSVYFPFYPYPRSTYSAIDIFYRIEWIYDPYHPEVYRRVLKWWLEARPIRFAIRYEYNTFVQETIGEPPVPKEIIDFTIWELFLRNFGKIIYFPKLEIRTYIKPSEKVIVDFTKSYPPLEYQIEREDMLDFVPDFVALRYLVQKSSLLPDDVLILLVTLANLLRLCDIHGYKEVFIGPFRLIKGKTQWVITSY